MVQRGNFIARTGGPGAYVSALVFLCLFPALLLITAPAAMADGLSYTGIYGYSEDMNGRFLQQTNHSANLAMEQDLTWAMNLSEDLRYSQSYQERGLYREDINPAARLGVNNDLFAVSLAASQSENRVEGKDPVFSRSTQADINSTWKGRWLPSLHVGVGSDRDYTDSDPRTSDRQIDHINTNADWGMGGIGLYYDFLAKKDKDRVAGSEYDFVSHLARFTANRTFWRDRLSFGFSHSYNFSSSDNANTATSAGLVFQKLVLSQALSGVDTTPLTGALGNNPGLNDGNRNNAALSVTVPGQGYNIVARVDLQTVDYLYLYTTSDLSSLLSSFSWRLYTSPNGSNWTQVTLNSSSVTFNPQNLRFEVPAGGLSAVYVKVVLDYALASPLPAFTEIEAYDVTVAAAGSQLKNTTDITTNQTSLSLGLRASENVKLSYSLSLYKKEYDPGRDSENRSQTGSANWHPNRYFDSTVTVGDSWRRESGQLDNSSRIYGLQLGSSILDTLDLNSSGSYTDNWRGEVKVSRNQHYTFDLTAQLYPDLRGLYSLTHDITETVATGAEDKSLAQTLEFSSDLTPRLASTVSGRYLEVDNPAGKTTTYVSGLSFAWHPGDLLSFTLQGTRTWHPGYIESQVLSVGANSKTSVNTQLDLTYILTKKNTTSQSGTVSFRWNLTRWLYWQNSGVYQTTAVNRFMFNSRLTANFSTY